MMNISTVSRQCLFEADYDTKAAEFMVAKRHEPGNCMIVHYRLHQQAVERMPAQLLMGRRRLDFQASLNGAACDTDGRGNVYIR
jgi:hypothetical protein